MSYARIILLTSLAMLAFASNSLLCRIALKHTDIDAASFTTIRLISGAIMLGMLMVFCGKYNGFSFLNSSFVEGKTTFIVSHRRESNS